MSAKFTTSSEMQVQTDAGSVAGALVQGQPGGSTIRVFKGIPYAAPPVGPLRWREPQLVTPWTGVREALAFGLDCPQTDDVGSCAPGQSEDCLTLNIWSPVGAQALPVMVWIHGGSFVAGSGSERRMDGTVLAREGVVVVTINYRLGLFGFLTHPALSRESAHAVSGNYGLLDKLSALQWVKANIAGFGGDPERVTAFGVSAGSASISLLLTSPLAKGLFQQAILESPGTARPLASLADAETAGTALGTDIDALRLLSGPEILARTSLLAPKVRGLTTPRVLRPIRDGWVIPQDERPAFRSGQLHLMPIILGTNADEGTQAVASWPAATLEQYRGLVEANFIGAVGRAMALYPATADTDARPRVGEMFSDTQFNYGTRLLARTMAAREARTWRYLFMRRRPGQTDGPHHGQEVAYVFGNLGTRHPGEPIGADAIDAAISTAMIKAWVAFAANGDPNRPGLAAWPAYEPQSDLHLEFGDSIRIGSGWRREQLDFLHGFYENGDRGK